MKITTALLLSVLLITGGKKDIFSSKSIENRMVKVSENLYANQYETTNKEYREFTQWIEANQPELLETVRVHGENWGNMTDDSYKSYYSKHAVFDQYPVVNISYDGAIAFCTWLTDRYNSNSKRKYQKVKFRLPSEKEWMMMAKGGKTYDPNYPWGGPFLKNKKGCYLANFYHIDDHRIKIDINNRDKMTIEKNENPSPFNGSDGFVFTAPVDSYMATGAGLHNLSGNAAEMLAEKGHTKGGSWGSSGYYIRIDAEDEFEGFTSSPYIGFRYVM